MTLYLLYHKRWVDDVFYDTKIIGIYSSHQRATDAIERYSYIPGFSEFNTGFYIDSFDVLCGRKSNSNKKNSIVYLLEGVCLIDSDEMIVSYDIYSNIIAAIWACVVKKLRRNKQPSKKFYIDRYFIDEDHWKEGFIVIDNP